MFFKLYSVYDSKAGAYITPFFLVNKGVALRSFMAACNDPASDFARFPGDYTLFELGDWEPETGKIKMYDAPLNLGTALQFKEIDSAVRVEE